MKKTSLTLAMTLAFLGTTSQIHAAGFQLAEYSSTGLGRAFAGEAAMADNAASQSRNPAMLSYLEGRQLSAGGIYVVPNIDVTGDIAISSPVFGDQVMHVPASAHDVAGPALVPNFYYSNQLNDQWTWGLTVNSNYGLATEIDKTHAAALFGNETAITTVEFNPNIAYKVNQQFTIGAGVRVVYGEGSISATTPYWVDGIKYNPAVPAEVAARLPESGTSLKAMEGDDISYGWKAGASWQINPQHRIGLAYHSGVELELDGYASGLLYDGGQDLSIEGYLPIELPAFAELATHHQISEKFALHASINWTQWSVFDELVAYFPGEQKPISGVDSDLVKDENFKDNWRYAVGGTYQLNHDWALRAGLALDTTAVEDDYRTTTIPDADRLWFSVGASYQATENLTIDFAATYIKMYGDAPINEAQDLAGLALVNFSGEATGDVWLAGIQFSYKM
ncbi:outer membrane protein transport protein [Shewanella gaetbuli]|uniref:Outer membrane protein transport protein n=1 Tax=Shewanella gaetbuli TaxID=220752 RepID=A0A9X2CLR5_9GAMM|nr:outer membrane protein transport protein [Shewanella gaetbuli]MCL1142880.1 outer membrane protein transport protein [Shewanella gaetbuli]